MLAWTKSSQEVIVLNASNAVYFYIADVALDSRRVSFQSTPKYLGAVIFVFVVRMIAASDAPMHAHL